MHVSSSIANVQMMNCFQLLLVAYYINKNSKRKELSQIEKAKPHEAYRYEAHSNAPSIINHTALVHEPQ